MKITRDTPRIVVIEDRPWALGLFLIGIMLFSAYVGLLFLDSGNWVVLACVAFLGGSAFWWFSRDIRYVRLTLLDDATAHLWIRGFKASLTRSFPPGVLRAAVQTDRSGDGETYRVVLLIDQGHSVERLPLTGYFTASLAPKRIAARIHAWRYSGILPDLDSQAPND